MIKYWKNILENNFKIVTFIILKNKKLTFKINNKKMSLI